MITTIKRKIFSMVAVTYAFTTFGVTAGDFFEEKTTDQKFNSKNNSKNISEDAAYINTTELLSSNFKNGSSFEWKMVNEFELFNTEVPFGVNDKGLSVHSKINNSGSFASEDEYSMKIKTNDFPSWILSKYSTLNEVRNAIGNISIFMDKDNLPLSYEISNNKNESLFLEVNNGDIKIVSA